MERESSWSTAILPLVLNHHEWRLTINGSLDKSYYYFTIPVHCVSLNTGTCKNRMFFILVLMDNFSDKEA